MSSVPVPLSRSDAKSAKSAVTVSIDSSVYSLPVVLRSVHSLAPRVVGQVSSAPTPGTIAVELWCKSGELLDECELRNRLLIALGDFVLRERLEEETLASRALIVRQAFDRNNLQLPELDVAPPSLDPLGLSRPDPETGREHVSES